LSYLYILTWVLHYSYIYNMYLFALYWIWILLDCYYVICLQNNEHILVGYLVYLFLTSNSWNLLSFTTLYNSRHNQWYGITVPKTYHCLFSAIFTKLSICLVFTLSYVSICLPILFWKLATVRYIYLIPLFASLFICLFHIWCFFLILLCVL
jgi:hypothetical protein